MNTKPCLASHPKDVRVPLARSHTTPTPAMRKQITRWNPFRELEQMQNRLASSWPFDPFANAGNGESVTIAEWSPRVDVVEDDKEFLIKAELPEMKREDVKVSVEDGVLTVSGERKFEKEDKSKKYRSEEHTSELQSLRHLVCRLLLEKKKTRPT